MYANQWILTLYSYSFPFDRVTRIFDSFLHDGAQTEGKLIFRVALAVLRLVRPRLLQLAFDDILPMLRRIPEGLASSPDAFMQLVFSERLTTAEIRSLREEYRDTDEGKAVLAGSEAGVLERREGMSSLTMVSPAQTPRGHAMRGQ